MIHKAMSPICKNICANGQPYKLHCE